MCGGSPCVDRREPPVTRMEDGCDHEEEAGRCAAKKHPCPDCKMCQWCAESRCRLCQGWLVVKKDATGEDAAGAMTRLRDE